MPVLSVVVTIVEGGGALRRCLDVLSAQQMRTPIEVIVPYDPTIAETGDLATRYQSVRFVSMPSVSSGTSRNAFDEHELYDRRRAAGLRVAHGQLVAMLEDRGYPAEDWAATMIDLHERLPFGAIGGVVDHGGTGALRWALFVADFGRYQPGVRGGAVEYLTDINICYKREALEAVRDLWQDAYKEATVNWALRRRGFDLYLSPSPVVVQQRGDVRLWPVLRERIHWARIFAHVRGRETSSRVSCLAWAAVTPALPIVLYVRHARRELSLRRHLREFVVASPVLLLLLSCWAFGECIGYLESAQRRGSRGPA